MSCRAISGASQILPATSSIAFSTSFLGSTLFYDVAAKCLPGPNLRFATREEVDKLLAPELMTTNRKLGRVCIDTASAEEHEAGGCSLTPG